MHSLNAGGIIMKKAKRKELKLVYVPYKEKYTEEEILEAKKQKAKLIDFIYKKFILPMKDE